MQSGSQREGEEEKHDHKCSYVLIEKEKNANKILLEILKEEEVVIGVDIEAAVEMSRFGILCLIQVIQI
jgi:hypothetical protein